MNDALAEDLHNLTRLHVSFLTRRDGEGWQIQASTLEPSERSALTLDIAANRFARKDAVGNADFGVDTVSRVIDLGSRADDNVIALLQEPLAAALEPFRRLQTPACAHLARRRDRFDRRQRADRARHRRGRCATCRDRGAANRGRRLRRRCRPTCATTRSATSQPRCARWAKGIAARESRILDLAYRDPLTELPNRALFAERLESALAPRRAPTARCPCC